LQRAVAQRVRIVVGVRLIQAAIDDAPARDLRLRVQAIDWLKRLGSTLSKEGVKVGIEVVKAAATKCVLQYFGLAG
jgi:hypothetical protein